MLLLSITLPPSGRQLFPILSGPSCSGYVPPHAVLSLRPFGPQSPISPSPPVTSAAAGPKPQPATANAPVGPPHGIWLNPMILELLNLLLTLFSLI